MKLKIILSLIILFSLWSCSQPDEYTPTAVENIVFFAEQTDIERGECTFLRWDVPGNGYALFDGLQASDTSLIQDVGLEDNTTYRVGIESVDNPASGFRIYIGNTNSGDYFFGSGIKERTSVKTGDTKIYFRAIADNVLKMTDAYCYKTYKNYYSDT